MGVVIAGGEGTGSLATLSSLIKPFVGSGILGLPKVWADGGIFASSIFLLLLAYIAGWCIFKLVECSDLIQQSEALRNAQYRILRQRKDKKSKEILSKGIELFQTIDNISIRDIIPDDSAELTTPSFTEIAVCAWGPIGRIVVDTCINITQLGGCSAYCIFISTSMSQVTGLPQVVWIGIMYLPLIGLSVIRKIDKLAPAAMAGNLVYIVVIAVIFYEGFSDACCIARETINYSDWRQYPMVFGTLSFALEGIPLILPVKQRMINQGDFTKIMRYAMFIIFFLYFFFAGFCYMFWGQDTMSPILSNLRAGALSNTVKCLLSLSLFFTFGLQCFPVATFFDIKLKAWLNIDTTNHGHMQPSEEEEEQGSEQQQNNDEDRRIDLSRRQQPDGQSEQQPPVVGRAAASRYANTKTLFVMETAHRVLFVSFCCMIALVFPQFDLIVALFGSFSNALLAYILPALFWVSICTPLLFTGVVYFKYDRQGNKLTHPMVLNTRQQQQDEQQDNNNRDNSDTDTDTDTDTTIDNNDRTPHNGKDYMSITSASDTLVSETSGLEVSMLGTASYPVGPKMSTLGRFLWVLFPYSVAILGCCASAVGVASAIEKIVEEFTSPK